MSSWMETSNTTSVDESYSSENDIESFEQTDYQKKRNFVKLLIPIIFLLIALCFIFFFFLFVHNLTYSNTYQTKHHQEEPENLKTFKDLKFSLGNAEKKFGGRRIFRHQNKRQFLRYDENEINLIQNGYSRMYSVKYNIYCCSEYIRRNTDFENCQILYEDMTYQYPAETEKEALELVNNSFEKEKTRLLKGCEEDEYLEKEIKSIKIVDESFICRGFCQPNNFNDFLSLHSPSIINVMIEIEKERREYDDYDFEEELIDEEGNPDGEITIEKKPKRSLPDESSAKKELIEIFNFVSLSCKKNGIESTSFEGRKFLSIDEAKSIYSGEIIQVFCDGISLDVVGKIRNLKFPGLCVPDFESIRCRDLKGYVSHVNRKKKKEKIEVRDDSNEFILDIEE